MLTLGEDPLHSSIPTPRAEIKTPNQVCAGIIAPNMPSNSGTTITCANQQEFTVNYSFTILWLMQF